MHVSRVSCMLVRILPAILLGGRLFAQMTVSGGITGTVVDASAQVQNVDKTIFLQPPFEWGDQ